MNPTPKLYEAMSKAQAEIKGAVKNGTNPHFRSAYSTLEDVWEACREPLTKNGLCVIQPMRIMEDGRMVLDTIVGHASGEEKVSSAYIPLAEKATPQAIGSAITYFRRYMLMSVVGICPTDDDGEAAEIASGRNKKIMPIEEVRSEITVSKPSPAQLRLISDLIEKKASREMTTSDNITAAVCGEFNLKHTGEITQAMVNPILDYLGYKSQKRSA